MLPHLAGRIFGTPLLLAQAKLDIILGVLGPRLGLTDVPPQALAPLVQKSTGAPVLSSGIAVLPICGTLVKRTVGLEADSGLTSYTSLAEQLQALVADSKVRGILLDVDSYGGEAHGVFEFSRSVRAAAAVKPLWAVANNSAFSAAYAIASSAQRVIVTETGGVGSVGVMALHVDQSAKDATEGYRYTAITAGAHKNDFSPHEPLTDTARAILQAETDRLYGMFVDHVASMRGLSADAVRGSEAALYFGAAGVAAGFADTVGTLESALAEFSQSLAVRRRLSPQARAAIFRNGAALEKESLTMPENQEVIGMEEAAALVADARRETSAQAQAIAELTMLAGCPERAAAYLAAGRTEADVRKELLTDRATASQQAEVTSTILPKSGTEPEKSDLLRQAVLKQLNKE